MPADTDTLILISVSLYRDRPSLLSIWATTPDIVFGHRRTDLEEPADAAGLMSRLGELVPRLLGGLSGLSPNAATLGEFQ